MTRTRVGAALAAAAVLFGVIAAWRNAWLSDDAFISFRYAENLTNGLGLVYNAGERVEGYSNFLWTIWIALGMRLGFAPEGWSMTWGVVFYAGSIALLYLEHNCALQRGGPRAASVPIACLVAAAHQDWSVFATSGLETSLFTFLVTLGFVLAVHPPLGWRGLAGSGLAFALAAMTRPDGVLFVPFVALYVAWTRPPLRLSLAAFAGAFALAWLPYVMWKVSFYGDFFPNTYNAKSANLTWYDQGWVYVRLYFQKYWVLALALPFAVAAFARRRDGGEDAPGHGHDALLAASLALVYTVYVMRVGGDFMYARFLVPVAPLYLVALERSLGSLLWRAPRAQWAAAAFAVAAVLATPIPLRGYEKTHGIVNERLVYTPEVVARHHQEGLTLRRYFSGLPVRMAYVGSQAALAYYARPAVAIESETGLTDRWIAHQRLERRGRVGHEKVAPVSYLLERKVHFVIRRFAAVTLGLDRELPVVPIAFDSIPGRIVHWDPVVLAEVKRRGARFPDLPRVIDDYIAVLDRLPDEQVADAYARLRRSYFAQVRDPAREAPFLARLERMHARGR